MLIIIIIVSQSWQGKTTEQFKIAITSQHRHRERTFMQQPALEYLLLPRCLPTGSCSRRYSMQSSPSLSRARKLNSTNSSFLIANMKDRIMTKKTIHLPTNCTLSTHRRSAWLCPPTAAQLLLLLLLFFPVMMTNVNHTEDKGVKALD